MKATNSGCAMRGSLNASDTPVLTTVNVIFNDKLQDVKLCTLEIFSDEYYCYIKDLERSLVNTKSI